MSADGIMQIVPEGRCEFSPAIYGWVNGEFNAQVPEGRLNSLTIHSVVPTGLKGFL